METERQNCFKKGGTKTLQMNINELIFHQKVSA